MKPGACCAAVRTIDAVVLTANSMASTSGIPTNVRSRPKAVSKSFKRPLAFLSGLTSSMIPVIPSAAWVGAKSIA